MSEITQILSDIEKGDPTAADQLLPLVYNELRELAAGNLAQESPGQTLEATALVHEAYVRLVDTQTVQNWNSRGHFFAAAAEAMRRILIEKARRKNADKHGGGWQRQDFLETELALESSGEAFLAVDEALRKLASIKPEIARVIEMRFFTGLKLEEIAAALQLSERTVYRHWAYARAWLRRELDRLD